MPDFDARTLIPVPAQQLFNWHARPGAFGRLAPPWAPLRIVQAAGGIQDGEVLIFKAGPAPFALTWEAHHEGYIEGEQFRDVQARGPLAHWAHTHRFLSQDAAHSIPHDHIEYRLPLHPISQWVAGFFVRRMLERMFTFRHERTMHDLTQHALHQDQPRQRVAITGASGLVGSALKDFLTTGGHTVLSITRKPSQGDPLTVHWDIEAGEIEREKLEGVDVVVHLAGEPVSQRWSAQTKQRILDSRVKGTRLISQTIATLKDPPRALLSSSAIGYYGDRDDEILFEQAERGTGFLSDVCEQWEQATQPALDAGIRVAHLRTSLVLDPSGGALKVMLTPFKLGVGGKIGSGKQFMSWIAIDDMVAAIQHIMFTEEISGAVNMAAPSPVRNEQFTKTLGAVLGRPTLLPVPKFGIKLVLGEDAAEEMLLASQRVVPGVLQGSGFMFSYPELEGALRHLLGKAK